MALLVALTVSIVAFVLLNVAVDPAQAIAGEDADLLLVEQIRAQYGFDRPIMVRYLDWLSRLLRGDLGESYYWNKPVGELILSHAPVTLRLAGLRRWPFS
jgi:peptide/nickel transport system permease protein